LRVMELAWPLFAVIGFILKVAYKILLGWWLDPRLQRKANRALLDDIEANLYTLVSEGEITVPSETAVLPFDYASISIIYKNISFCFTRGRGDITVSVSPRHVPAESHDLASVVAGIDRRNLSERDFVHDLAGAARLLRPRLEALNDAFSEGKYPAFRKTL